MKSTLIRIQPFLQEKPYFPYILDRFSVIFLRLFFHRESPIFFTFWTDFLSFPLGFPWFFLGKTLFSLHFGQISCHFLEEVTDFLHLAEPKGRHTVTP